MLRCRHAVRTTLYPSISNIDYSILTNTFSENRERAIGFGETAAGLGLMVGPILGGSLNTAFGYAYCYYILSGFLAFAALFNVVVMPNSINFSNKEEDPLPMTQEEKERALEEFDKMSKEASKKAGYGMILFNRRAAFALLSCSMVMLFVSFKQAFMTVVLENEYHVEQVYHGWIIAMPALFYVISGNVVGLVIDKAPRRVFLCAAFLIMAVSNFLMGPSKLLFLPPELWIFFVGYAINGVSQGFIFIPILPEVLEAVYQKEKLVEGDDEVLDGIINDKAAALYGLFYALGAISAPILGSMVYNLLSNDWWYTCDVFAIISSIYVVIFFVFNIMPDIHKERQQRQEMAEMLMQSEHFNRVININIIGEGEIEQEHGNGAKGFDNTRATALFAPAHSS